MPVSADASARRRLSRADWIAAARALLAEQGVERLAVEPLARRVGATKGSFYWHFADRGALLEAVLADWSDRATAAVITEVERAPDDERLAALLAHALGEADDEDEALERAVLAAADDPRVTPAVARVHAARVEYLCRLFADRGLPPARAQARARICYAAYLGGRQLDALPGGPPGARVAYREELLRMVTAP
ncbi:TetR/AcrR family transcriptional regulator [Naumannella huperziae]